jgi:integrase
LKGALTPWRPVNFASATTPAEITPVLRKIHDYAGGAIVRTALLLAPLLFARPGELAAMKWADLNLEAGEWRYLVPKTKRAHISALSTQAVDLLRDLQPLTGRGEFVFPGARDRKKPMSGNALLQAMRRSGIGKEEMTVHGFRHMASTRLNEMGWPPDAIEAALTHRMPGVRGVYNSASYLDERRKMAQAWANYLDNLRGGTNVIPMRRSV